LNSALQTLLAKSKAFELVQAELLGLH